MEDSSIIDIELWRLISAYLFVLILILIFKVRGITRQKTLAIAAFRMTLQLVIAGYVLTYLFELSNPFLTLGVIFIMEGFAIYTIYKQAGTRLSVSLKKNHCDLLGMGIIFLPGMETGQILSGVSPLLAIEYQIVILLGILGSVGLSVILFILLAYKNFFNQEAQFSPEGKS
ncbi:MAG: ABC transporter permease [Bacillota bacterium]